MVWQFKSVNNKKKTQSQLIALGNLERFKIQSQLTALGNLEKFPNLEKFKTQSQLTALGNLDPEGEAVPDADSLHLLQGGVEDPDAGAGGLGGRRDGDHVRVSAISDTILTVIFIYFQVHQYF